MRRPTLFALAGIYDVWKGDGGRSITSFFIDTTDAAPSVAQYRSSSRIRRSTRGCAARLIRRLR